MNTLRLSIRALCVTAGLAGLTLAAAAAEVTPPPGLPLVASAHHHAGGELARVLKRLDLSPDQRTQIHSILQLAMPQMKALHASLRANHEALADAAPTDPSYPSLLATEKANAAARVQMASDVKTQIYAVLTPAQQAQIPALLAEARAARAAKLASWHHSL